MKVLLINPASDFLTFKTHEVLGLGYLAATLDRAGHQVEIYDCNFQDPETALIADHIRRGDYGLIGIATMIGKTAHANRIAYEARRVSDAFIILGGYSATYEYESIMTECPGIDAILRGEGEEVLRELIERLERGDDWHDLKSIVYREGERVVANPMLTLHMNLDDFPFPWRSPYLDRIGLASILSARGCYAKCSFCNIQEFYNLSGYGGIRVRSARNVVDEIEQINARNGVRKFLFIDDDMLGADFYAKGRNAQIAEEIIKRGLDVEFEVAGRANDVIKFEDTIARLKEAGLTRVYIGIESGSDTQLKRQRKGVNKTHNARSLEVLKRHGLGLDMGFIPFDPWTTPAELVENMKFLNESGVMEASNLNTAAVTMILYPGTELYDRAKAEDLFLRAQRYTYAYRFKNDEHAELFTRVIYTIKSKMVLEAVDRFIGGMKKDPVVRSETEAVVDPAARKLFSLWAQLFEIWCEGREAPALEAEIETMESVLQNYCNSAAHLKRMRETLPPENNGGGARRQTLATYAAARAELAECLHGLIRGDGQPVAARWRDQYAVDELYTELLWRQHADGGGPLARRYDAGPDSRRDLPVRGQEGRLKLENFLPPVPLEAGAGVYVGFNIYAPPDIFAEHTRREVTSQIEKFDTTLRVTLGDGVSLESGIKIYRGWNEVELPFTVAEAGAAPDLIITSRTPLETDLQLGATWWRQTA